MSIIKRARKGKIEAAVDAIDAADLVQLKDRVNPPIPPH
jgi:hypothetical protein